jgi:hypothetical protein
MTHQPSLPDAYPLQWPDGWPRTKFPRDSRYKRNPESYIRNELLDSIRKLGGTLPIISSNVEVRLDGLPYANRRLPEDGGIAVYWVRDGKQEVMACDRWKRPWENMRAVYHAIEGLRSMERAGATQIMERAFQAFQLPTGSSKRSWQELLGDDIHDADDARAAFRERAKHLHPDQGGDIEKFQELEQAYREALQYFND